ncbi:hypothetical protein Asp14428_68870 [Actinoplanes sp. NBRC 14428]|nr:hypothetical protein Asp14428_68870 [Actinoplanes sp. NBRC 14428]
MVVLFAGPPQIDAFRRAWSAAAVDLHQDPVDVHVVMAGDYLGELASAAGGDGPLRRTLPFIAGFLDEKGADGLALRPGRGGTSSRRPGRRRPR